MHSNKIRAHYVVIPRENSMRYETEQIDPDDVGPYDVLVEAENSVISTGTEIAGYTGRDPGVHKAGSYNEYPWRPGYGVVGRLLRVGEGIAHVAEGDRVLCMASHASHQIYNIGPQRRPWHNAYRIRDDVPGHLAVMARMALVAITGPQSVEFEAGDSVIVFGLGLVGNLAAQLFQIGGARVIGVDPLPERCDYAREAGIETVLQLQPDEQRDALLEETDGRGADVTVDAVGHGRVFETAVFTTAQFGDVVILGSPRAPVEMNVTPVLSHIHHQFINVRGALEWKNPAFDTLGAKHSIASNLKNILDFIASGMLNVEAIISDVIEPSEMPQMYAELAANLREHLGVVVDWSGV